MQYPSHSFSTHQTAQSLSLPPRAIVLSGTLGSGKTTLLNHLLTTQTKSATPGSFVVIENDIGATNTDTARLKTDPTNVLAITAGCICCNDLHSLRAAVSQLREQPEIKTLFIETTGIAKPSAVKELLHKLSIPTLVIVTVDVKHFDTNQILGRTTDTIPHADILALTWTHNSHGDRDNDALTKAMDTIERLNPSARTVEIAPDGTPLAPMDLNTASVGRSFSLPTPRSFSLLPSLTSLFAPAHSHDHHTHHHHEFTITLPLPIGMSPDDVIAAVQAAGPIGLLRAKGRVGRFDIDCTVGDWKISEGNVKDGRNFITLIGTKPLSADYFPALASTHSGEDISIDMTDPLVRERAIGLVTDLLSLIPKDVVQGDRLITETEAGEAWRYVSLPGFPAELKERFLRSLCDFYLKQSEALRYDTFAAHPTLPYYQREVGYNLSWFLIDCGDLVAKWGLESEIKGLKPVTLYFTGLQSARDARHIGTFSQSDEPYLRQRLEMLRAEGGDRSLATQALANCARLCLDKSWNQAVRVLRESE